MIFEAPYKLIGSTNLRLHLHPEHLADLRKSGLFDETIRAASVYSIAPSDIAEFFSKRKGVPAEINSAMCFPYQGGEFARIKLFPQVGTRKYSQPPRTSARLYVPFPVRDGNLHVCEGEKKYLAAHQAGLNAVGIGGIWNWLTEHRPIADINLVDWDGRDAVILPDSDVFERPKLLCAIYALGREIRDRGATVTVARIPQDGETKVGFDDYLVAGGRVDDLDLFTLDQRIFQGARAWHGRWKVRGAVAA